MICLQLLLSGLDNANMPNFQGTYYYEVVIENEDKTDLWKLHA